MQGENRKINRHRFVAMPVLPGEASGGWRWGEVIK